MVFDLQTFVANPTVEVLDDCRKCDLLEIAHHYSIAVSSALRVNEVREVVLPGLVGGGMLILPKPDEVAGVVTAPGDVGASSVCRCGECRSACRPFRGSTSFGVAQSMLF